MNVTKEHIEQYLSELHGAVGAGNYQIASRYKNMDMYIDYIFTEKDARGLLLSLRPEDFSEAVRNAHAGYSQELLYIFGKDIRLLPRFGGGEETVPLYLKLNKVRGPYVFVISMHRQEAPLFYPLKACACGKSSGAGEQLCKEKTSYVGEQFCREKTPCVGEQFCQGKISCAGEPYCREKGVLL